MKPEIDKDRLISFKAYYKAMQEETPPSFRINWWIVVCVFIIITLGVYIYLQSNLKDIKVAERQKKEIVREIDSLTLHRDSVIRNSVKSTITRAKKSDSLFKSLKNEKHIIRDTTFNAMYQYISNYRYSGATIEAD